jgi:hypothetical protein
MVRKHFCFGVELLQLGFKFSPASFQFRSFVLIMLAQGPDCGVEVGQLENLNWVHVASSHRLCTRQAELPADDTTRRV